MDVHKARPFCGARGRAFRRFSDSAKLSPLLGGGLEMRSIKRLGEFVGGALLTVVFGACAQTGYIYTKTGDSGPAKPPNCDFVIATTKVDRPYKEVGILDSQDNPPSNAADFKERVRRQVCEAGGDAVVAEVSGHGYYIRGTVLRFTEGEPAAAATTAPPAP